MDYCTHLTRCYDAFAPEKHGEYGLCCEVDEQTGEFMYLLGVAFDDKADLKVLINVF